MFTTLVILASIGADAKLKQAPRLPQAPPARAVGNCGDPNCPCGCATGAPCTCVKAVKTFTNTNLVCEGGTCAVNGTTVTCANGVCTPTTVSPPVQYAQPTHAPTVYYRTPPVQLMHFGGYGGYSRGFGGGGGCSGGSCR